MPASESKPPRVFISYSHESQVHLDRVQKLANRLRAEKVDCIIDQYQDFPPSGWLDWMDNEFSTAEFILVVCTEIYCRRFERREPRGVGQGVKWEGAIINDELYRNESINKRFIPIVFETADEEHIPLKLRKYTHYNLTTEDGYEMLYRLITSQPKLMKPPLGEKRVLPTINQKQNYTPTELKPPASVSDDNTSITLPQIYSTIQVPRVSISQILLAIFFMFFLLFINDFIQNYQSKNTSPKPKQEPLPTPQSSQKSFSIELGNNVQLIMVEIPEGEFEMGSKESSLSELYGGWPSIIKNESPPYKVKMRSFAIGRFEVTQAEWREVMGESPNSRFHGDRLPTDNVSWKQAQEFIEKLRKKTKNLSFRLPTESEWEYAARAGETGIWSFGNDENELDKYAWFAKNALDRTHDVGTMKANKWGIYDLYGNLQEWCQDEYLENAYTNKFRQIQSETQNIYVPHSALTESGEGSNCTNFVIRGGSWRTDASGCRSGSRALACVETSNDKIGLRVACDLPISSP